jgi:hypothetical protein
VSTPDPNDLRDPRFDAAWRSASHEEPPAALDDAIRAAARREVSAGPQSTKMRAPSTRSALSPQRWWAPLAAAATIGAIAVGVLQLASPDKVVAPASDKAVVSDMPAPVSSAVAPPPPSSVGVPAPSTASPPTEPRSRAPGGNTDERTAPPSPASAPSPAAPVATPAPLPPSLRKDAVVPFPAEQRAAAAAESAPAKTTAESDRQTGALDAAKPASPAEPFPADAVKREAQEAAASAPSAPAPSAHAGAPGLAAGKLSAAPAPVAREEATRDAARVDTPVAQAPMRRMQEAAGARAGAASNYAGGTSDVRAKVPPKLAVPDWIALIRKLRDEGKTDEAAKELAAFRAAHPDHEELLPPDLRTWKPAAR